MTNLNKCFIVLLIIICSNFYVSAQNTEEFKDEFIPADPEVKIGKLENGLTYYIRKNTEPEKRAELYLVIKAGSLQENDLQKGLAHFTEHMAFNGTKSYPENKLIDFLQKAGIRFGADLNAYTGFDQTVYQLPMPTDSLKLFETGFDILAEWAGHVTFNPQEIDKERGVIIEEERQRGKNVSERISKQLLPVLLANSRYVERLPIGDLDIIQNFKHETLIQFYKDWYRPELMAVIAVGDFDEEQVELLIKKKFSGLNSSSSISQPKKYFIPANEEPLVKIVTDPEYPYTVASIIFKHPESIIKTSLDLRNSIIKSAVVRMLSLRIKEQIKEGKATFLDASAGYGPYQGGIGNLDAFTLQLVAKSPEQLQESIEGLMNEILKMKRYGFTESEFFRIKKDYLNAIDKSYKERDKATSKSYINQYLDHFLKCKAIIPIEYSHTFYHTYLDKIQINEINAMAPSLVTKDNQIILLQASEKVKNLLPNEETLLDWANNDKRDVDAYIDDAVDAPLISAMPKGGKTTRTKYLKSLNTTELVLSNGVKVILKPTDFKNDEILFTAFSKGGYSLSAETNLPSTKIAGNIISSSGIGNFNPNQLSKLLSGKSLSVNPYINTYSEGIKGSAAPKDMETALELVYLYFSQPRKDKTTFKRHLENSKVYLEGKQSNPMAVFQDTINVALKGRSAWATPTTLEQINGLSLDKAFDFYKERFADAGDFTFLFVGNFEVDSMKVLIEKYLGTLPSTNTKENFKDVGIKPLKGKVSKTVYKGLEDKALIVLVYHGDYKYNEKNNLSLKVLKSALETRLLERLREKESGVYSPSVNLSYVKIPSPHYSLAISFSCATERAEQLMAATEDEIGKMISEGPTSDELEKFVAQEKRQKELQLRTNGFWLGYLHDVYNKESDPDFIKVYNKQLDAIKTKDIKKAAKRYLESEDVLQLQLLPEHLQVENLN